MNKSKKSQITLFIILALVIVFAVLFLIYIKNISLFFQPSKVIPQDVEPIKNLIENCIESEAIPLIEHMMLHSGYADLVQFLPADYFPEIRVPYSLPQNREEMEDSLKNKIRIKLKDCIDFTKFPQFNIIEKGAPELTVKIYEEDVTLSLKYPIEIINKQNNEKTKLLDFKKIIQTKLGKLFDLAKAVMQIEDLGITKENPITLEPRQVHFLEEMTMDIIASNNPDIFPYYGTEITTKKKTWSIEKLKQALKERLIENLDCISYEGTASTLPGSCEEYSDYYLKRFSIPVTQDIKYKNTVVTTSHTFSDEWEFTEFLVNPSRGDTVSQIEMPLKLIPIKYYNHKYTMRYPILFKLIEDQDIFNFATEVFIVNNQASRIFEFSSYLPAIDLEDFCEDKEIPLTVEVNDKSTNKPLKDVKIEYSCGGFKCELGYTKQKMFAENIPLHGSSPNLEVKVPFCSNGLIITNKDDYLEKREFIFKEKTYSESLEGEDITIEMLPLKKMDYEFNIYDYSTKEERKLQNDESVMITLSNKEENYDKTIYYSSELKDEKIDFILGNYKYDINIYMTKDDKLIGGYTLSEWEPYYYDLLDKNKLTFYIFANPTLTEQDFVNFWEETVKKESKFYEPIIT